MPEGKESIPETEREDRQTVECVERTEDPVENRETEELRAAERDQAHAPRDAEGFLGEQTVQGLGGGEPGDPGLLRQERIHPRPAETVDTETQETTERV